jgi:hypothetical protein
MAENTIIRALSIVHQKRLQEDGLWRLDSPTVSACCCFCLSKNNCCAWRGVCADEAPCSIPQEAALVAQLCNRQQDEVRPSLCVLRSPALQQLQKLARALLPWYAPCTMITKVVLCTLCLTADLCGGCVLQEVVVSVGNPQQEPDYCFAHLAPPHIHGSDKMRQ